MRRMKGGVPPVQVNVYESHSSGGGNGAVILKSESARTEVTDRNERAQEVRILMVRAIASTPSDIQGKLIGATSPVLQLF